jgi:hypothetical protein
MIRIKDLYEKIVSPKSTDVVKIASALPVLEEMSSLLDLLASPWAMVVKDMIPFAPAAIAILQQFKDELSVEECVVFIAQVAYLESWQEEIKQKPDWWGKVKEDLPSPKFDEKLFALGEMEIDSAGLMAILDELPTSELMARFNGILSTRLQELGLEESDSRAIVLRVAGRTDRYLHQILADNADQVEVLAEFSHTGELDKTKYYASIDRYLATEIAPLPNEILFETEHLQLTIGDIYVSLNVQPLAQDGSPTAQPPMPIKTWAVDRLLDPKSNKILLVEGMAGSGKSTFCRMFADYTRRKLPFIPILIRLRKLSSILQERDYFGKYANDQTFTQTLDVLLKDSGFVYDGWLTNKNQRCLFLLDGWDELGSAESIDLLGQVERFQERSHHRCLITSRTLAIKNLERSIFDPDCLERVELINTIDRKSWLDKWEAKFGLVDRQGLEKFIQTYSQDTHEIGDSSIDANLVGEPLRLYLLGRIYQENQHQVTDRLLREFRLKSMSRI